MNRILCLLWIVGLIAACQRSGDAPAGGGATAAAAAALPARLEIGRAATPAEIAAWDLDVNPKGEGLPPGTGTHASGTGVYAAKCAVCHGAKGEGLPPNPKLVGREPRDFTFAEDRAHVKTVGNYWPWATTLFDYTRRAMPQTAPGSLTPDETYSVVAWMLAENEIIARDYVIDASSLPQVVMPARDRFVRDDRMGGAAFR
jgi:cytochrome c